MSDPPAASEPAHRRRRHAPVRRFALTGLAVFLVVAGVVGGAVGRLSGQRREPAWSARLGPLAELPAEPGTAVAVALPEGTAPDRTSRLIMEAATLRPDLNWGVSGAWRGDRPAEAIVTLGYGTPPPHARLVWSEGVVGLWRP